jgi:hypothetical protein
VTPAWTRTRDNANQPTSIPQSALVLPDVGHPARTTADFIGSAGAPVHLVLALKVTIVIVLTDRTP